MSNMSCSWLWPGCKRTPIRGRQNAERLSGATMRSYGSPGSAGLEKKVEPTTTEPTWSTYGWWPTSSVRSSDKIHYLERGSGPRLATLRICSRRWPNARRERPTCPRPSFPSRNELPSPPTTLEASPRRRHHQLTTPSSKNPAETSHPSFIQTRR
jgi:hypothetical protein